MSCFFRFRPERWFTDFAIVNGNRIPIRAIAEKAAIDMGENFGPLRITAEFDRDSWEMRVWTLLISSNTETHGWTACNKTTEFVKNILVEEHGAYIPWYKR